MKKSLPLCCIAVSLAAGTAALAPTGFKELHSPSAGAVERTPGAMPRETAPTLEADSEILYFNDFNTEESTQGLTVIDNNHDGKTWTHALQNGQGWIACQYNKDLPMDDWLIFPALNLERGKVYTASFLACAQDDQYNERVELRWGYEPTVEGMENTAVPPVLLTSPHFVTVSGQISIKEERPVYIAIHGCSEANKWQLSVDNFTVQAGKANTSPAPVTDLRAVPGTGGEKAVEISFTTPNTNIGGAPLAELTQVELMRGNDIIEIWENPRMGSKLTYTDHPAQTGDYTYSVVCSNSDGSSEPVSVSVYVGMNFPAQPEEVSVAYEGSGYRNVRISWTPVTKDTDGFPLQDGEVTYRVYVNDDAYNPTCISEGSDATTCTYNYTGEEQDFFNFAVSAVTTRGEGEVTWSSEFITVGTPLDALSEHFQNAQFHYPWAIWRHGFSNIEMWTDGTGESYSVTHDGGFVTLQGSGYGNGISLVSPLIDLSSTPQPAISFYADNIMSKKPDANTIQVQVCTPGGELVSLLGPVSCVEQSGAREGWYRVLTDLSDYAGQVIQFRITAINYRFKNTLVDDIDIMTMADRDLAVEKTSIGYKPLHDTPFSVRSTVANHGRLAASGWKMSLFRDGEKIDTKEGTDLAPGARCEVAFDHLFTPLDEDRVLFHTELEFEGDSDAENNRSYTLQATPRAYGYPAVEDLAACSFGNGSYLCWTQPEIPETEAIPIVEDFETAGSMAREFGDWIFVDEDKSPLGGTGMDVPGLTPGETTGSFMIWDNSLFSFPSYGGISGQKYLCSLYRADDGKADDWAISPELSGAQQTISFYAKSFIGDYCETMEILYSTGSTSPGDFILLQEQKFLPGRWMKYNYTLPEGAKRFAIRCTTLDGYMLMIDDLTYRPAHGPHHGLEPAGHDVYRNGEKIATLPAGQNDFSDQSALEGDTYHVATLYNKGVSAKSNAALFSTSGVVLPATGPAIDGEGATRIYTLQGIPASPEAKGGVYITVAPGGARKVRR